MLGGHKDLFCPPELDLLRFDDMYEWQQETGYSPSYRWPAQGLQAAFAELMRISPDGAWTLLNEMAADKRAVQSVYAQLQDLSGERMLVDKTVAYSTDAGALRRAEALFDAPKYIYLVRHPFAVIESCLRLRLDRRFNPALSDDPNIDPYAVAEIIWDACNENLLQFFEHIEPERWHMVRFEALVSQPASVMAHLSRFLGIPFDESLLDPYDGRRERMIAGFGDPNILRRTEIDASLGEVWRQIRLPRALDVSTRRLAGRLGYQMSDGAGAPVTDGLFTEDGSQRS